MYLKNCCALFLLALVACQAAPSTLKSIEKKSISEKTNKVEKDDLKIENPGLDKDRTKKSTSFCVEIRDGREVPCLDVKEPTLLVKPFKQTVINHSPAYTDYPIKFNEIQTPVQVIHARPQQSQIQIAPIPQPIQTVQPVPQQIQTVQSVPQLIQTVQQVPQQISQPVAQPVFYVPPPVPAYNIPAMQTPSSQPTPIVNILTPPAAPCNVMPASTVIEHKQEPLREVEYVQPVPKPERPEPEFKPKPVSFPQPMEIMSVVDSAPCKQDVVVLSSKPLTVYPEKQLAMEMTELEPQPISSAQCICSQKGRPHSSLFRHHPKMHEHHVMVHPTSNIAATNPLIQPPYPLSYLSNNHPIVFGEYPTNSDTIISVHQEQARPYYPNIHSTWYPSKYPEYISHPNTYDSQHVSPSVTVNAFPYTDATGTFRQSSSQKLMENNELEKEHSVAHQTIDVTSETSKREAAPIQPEKNQQANIMQEQIVKSGNNIPVEMKFGKQKSMM